MRFRPCNCSYKVSVNNFKMVNNINLPPSEFDYDDRIASSGTPPDNFITISPEFLDFSPELLNQILRADELNIGCEVDIFQAIMRWYEHDKNARATNLSLLMGSLRLEHFDGAFIEKSLKPLPGCEQLAEKALKLMNVGGYTKAENERKCGLLILNDVKKLKYILRYNPALNKWQKCFELKFRDYSYGLVYYESSLFFIGGRGRGFQRNNTVKRLNLQTFTWVEMASMFQRRDDLCAVMLNGKIYAFGGHDGGDPFNTVEMFDISTNHWQVLPAMSAHRYGASVIAYEEKIYIFGGLGIDCKPLNSVECYDPKTSSWTTCSNMNGARGWPGITILNEFIFLIGGYNEGMLNTVERYDPKQNVWLEVAPLKLARFGICAITVGKRIWALGGHDVYTVDEYNFENNEWNEKTALPIYGVHSYVEVPNQLVDRMQSKFLCKSL